MTPEAKKDIQDTLMAVMAKHQVNRGVFILADPEDGHVITIAINTPKEAQLIVFAMVTKEILMDLAALEDGPKTAH